MKITRTKLKRTSEGFIALMSVLVISLVLLGISFTNSTNGFFSRFAQLDAEDKRVGLSLAESCVNTALLKIAQDYNFNVGSGLTVSINPSANPPTSCTIKSISYGPEDPTTHQKTATIATQAQYEGTWSNVSVAATMQDPNWVPVLRGALTVVTHVINDNSGTKQAGDFTVNVTGANPSPASSAGSEAGTTVYVTGGATFNVAQPSLSGYVQSLNGSCTNATIAAGANATCTITENDVPSTGKLTVIANMINDNGGNVQPQNVQLFLDGAGVQSGAIQTNLTPGQHTVSANPISGYSLSPWGINCNASGTIQINAGSNLTCEITFDDNPSNAPICADTVMILDRTGSMSGSDLAGEKAAAGALINLYSSVSPAPKLGIGSFGAYPNASLPAGAAGIPTLGQLTSNFNNLTTVLGQITGSNSSVGSDLSAAITVANNELSSSRHDPTKQKVLIMVSDGVPNQPTGTTSTTTATFAPTASSNDGSANWVNPNGAYANGGSDANASVNGSANKERFYNFNFPTVPSNATVKGIAITADAWESDSVRAPGSCQLGMDLSWNAGTSWTTPEKTQRLTTTESSYILGSATDDWSAAHTWAPGEFTNATFRARIHAIDPGANCDNNAIDHLDFLRGQITYTIPDDPTELALTAADNTKLSGTQIFTIHFGDTSGDTLLAQLATGSTTNSGHQTGAANDQSDNKTSGSIGPKPTTQTITGSQWNNPKNAFISDNVYASSTINNAQEWYGNFFGSTPVQAGVDISGIAVKIEAKTTNTTNCKIGVELSADNGKTFATSSTTISPTTTENIYTIGGSSTLWGHTWLWSDLSDGKFAVRLQNNCPTGTVISVDQVQAQAYYNFVPENIDGDNFFISPTSADMQNIFQTIGTKVCPAIIAPPPAPAPSTATLIVLTNVINDNGGINQPADFTSLVNASNPTPVGSPAGTYPGQSSPGLLLTVTPGAYSVDQSPMSGYTKSLGVDCLAGSTILPGGIKTCSMTDDDTAPSATIPTAPPSLSNININSWSEATTTH